MVSDEGIDVEQAIVGDPLEDSSDEFRVVSAKGGGVMGVGGFELLEDLVLGEGGLGGVCLLEVREEERGFDGEDG